MESLYLFYMGQKNSIRDDLAIERTELANERTLLAYMRTCFASFGLGIVIKKLLPTRLGEVLGNLFILGSFFIIFFGTKKFKEYKKRIDAKK